MQGSYPTKLVKLVITNNVMWYTWAGLFQNMNASQVEEAVHQKKREQKVAHEAKVERDKKSREAQKQKAQDRKEKEKKRTQKQERRR